MAAIVIGIVSIALAALAMRLTADDSEPTTTESASSVSSSLADWRESIVAPTDVVDGAQTATQGLVTLAVLVPKSQVSAHRRVAGSE